MRSRTAFVAVVAVAVVLAGVAPPVVAAFGGTPAESGAAGGRATQSATTVAPTQAETATRTVTARTATPSPTRTRTTILQETTTPRPTADSATTTPSDRRPAAVPNATRAKVGAELLSDDGETDRTATVRRAGTLSVRSSDGPAGRSVVVELDAANVAAGRAAVARVLGRDARTAAHGRYVEATATREEILALANESAVSFVRAPVRPVSFAGSDGTTEALQTAELESLHARGYGGANVTVAVIDVDQFDLDHPALKGRVAKTRDYTGAGVDGTGGHGTATAELVAETAPNASLVLVRVDSLFDFYRAVDWLESNTSTDVVSMSLGWYNVGPLDGTSEMDDAIDDSVANGTSWVVSAGNSAGGHHWNGTWSDPDGDGYLNVNGSTESLAIDANDRVTVWAQWNDWPGTDQDYKLCLYADADVENATALRCADDYQVGAQNPTEAFTEYLDDYGISTAYLTIERVSADGTADFDVFLNDGAEFTDEWTDARSLTLAATNRRAVSVGAYDHATGRLESFSSRGPTIDGRRKPDVVAADGVTSSVYANGFYGTSAAAPHAAGVLATMLDANRRLSPAELKTNLTRSARPVGTVPNAQTGYGEVDASNALARLGAYDLPPDGRLRYDGDYRLDTGGSATPDSLVVDAANVTLDGDGRAFAAAEGGAVLTTTANATNLTVRDPTVRDRPVGVEAANLTTLELTNVSAETTTALRVSNVTNVTLTNVSPDDAPSFDLRGTDLSVALDAADAPPNRSRLSAAPNLTFARANRTANVSVANATTNATNATMTLRYDESHANESTVAVWTNAGGDWTETNASVDTDANAVTVEANENGTYGVYAVGEPAANRTNLSLSAEVDATATGDAAVSNVGRANLTVLDADIVGPDADQFGLANPPKNVTVTPGTTLDVTVSYAPNASRDHAATLSVTTAELGVLDVALDGTATVPTTPTPTPSPTPTSTSTATPTPEDDDSSGSGSSGAPPPPPAPSTPEPTPTPTLTATPTVTHTTTTPTVTATVTATNTPAATATPRPERAAAERESETTARVERTATDADRTTASAERTATAQSNESGDGRATPAVTGTGVPGFSPVTAVVAVAAAASLLLRRD